MQTVFSDIGLMVPEIYLPKTWVNMQHRSVVACDQYTSQPEYRKQVQQLIHDDPSTYHITFPEVFLESEDKQERIQAIQKNMLNYLEQGILENQGHCFVLVDRKTSHTTSRKWLIVALDLEKYDYSIWSQTLIRATEWTVIDRLPPRIEIRKDAALELPHIMVLIDDPAQTVIEPLFANREKYPKLYDTDLMMNGGHISGYKIADEASIAQIANNLAQLANTETFVQKYNLHDQLWVLLFAMGDGNHSLATAKAIWETKKQTLTEQQRETDPARFALVELVNIHDQWLEFEPIHRVVFNVDPQDMLEHMKIYFNQQWSQINIEQYTTFEEMQNNTKKSDHTTHYFAAMYADHYITIQLTNPKLNLEVGNLQAFLDQYLSQHSESKIDYIHGEEITKNLGTKNGNIGFILPIMDKKDFFTTVIIDGALPRKTFSMGEAEEKRYYLECRKIK